MSTTSYDFKKVTVVVGGAIITGFHDGSTVKTEKGEDNVKTHVGAAGDVTFSEIANSTGKITLTLKQNSSSLPFLISLSKSKTTFNASVTDSNTDRVTGGTECRIIKTPGAEYGPEIAGVEVQIFVADYDVK